MFGSDITNADIRATPVSACRHPKNVLLLELWTSHKSKDGIVERKDLTPNALKPLLGGISISEQVDNGKNYRFRLVGATNERRLGISATGRLLTDLYSEDSAREIITLHNRVIKTGEPEVLHGRILGFGVDHVEFEALFLPVRSSGGDFQILAGMYDLAGTQ